MVVSKAKAKDTKKRKQSPPPQQQQQQQQPTAVESSPPEMPKRTKVQAQRKFAQGQSAPTSSSYNALNVASSSSNTGPSTSSESREPPTEILPNKRPKTEDFLTFLCFRGTPALPAHLDFLNQGKAKIEESTVKKTIVKPPKAAKKNKKGRPPKNAAALAAAAAAAEAAAAENEENKASTSKAAPTTTTTATAGQIDAETAQAFVAKENATVNEVNIKPDNVVMPFAVRKRAEVIAEGNRRGRTAAEKCNSATDAKRQRSTKSGGTKTDAKAANEPETDEEDEYFSANDDAEKTEENKNNCRNESKTVKTPLSVERKSETPSKESETGKSRKGRPPSAAKKAKEALKEAAAEANKPKESPKTTLKSEQNIKQTVKRPRQKESPIFIPSPEPSGRMTRQRAFFEPVKVPHHDAENEQKAKEENTADITIKSENSRNETESKIENEKDKDKEDEMKISKASNNKATVKSDKTESVNNNVETEKTIKPNMNVFDFSSDDEQPLAKTIKLKKGKAATSKKSAGRNNKAAAKKPPPKKATEKKEAVVQNENLHKRESEKLVEEVKDNSKNKLAVDHLASAQKLSEAKVEKAAEGAKNKNKRGKNAKKKDKLEQANDVDDVGGGDNDKADDVGKDDKDLLPPAPKKHTTNVRQSRKRTKTGIANETINGDEEEKDAPVRNQRPTRKTKEAAAIYMGIIGHKLQLADDEDDDLSLNSFPDLPNVKEMEKMENELKKNAAQVATGTTTATSTPTVTAKAATIAAGKLRNLSPAAAATSKAASKQPSATTQSPLTLEKPPPTGRRGRPPKLNKQAPPAKREIEGMLVKKGAITKIATAANATMATENVHAKEKSEASKADSEDEDFLLNEEVKETKRKLEKSFSDSDDEPLAIKAHVKISDKDAEYYVKKSESQQQNSITSPTTTAAAAAALTMLPLSSSKVVSTLPPSTSGAAHIATSSPPVTASIATASQQQQQQQATSQAPSPFKTIEKKSPVPTSKILNVPATYATPGVNLPFNKTTSYLPQTSPHYHASHVRPPNTHQFPTAKSPTTPAPPAPTHLTAPLPPQSPIKYQTPPTTYPPPIEAYPSPKINPNFLTPKFDRASLPRTNNFPSPSPVKFDVTSSTAKSGIVANSILSAKTPTIVGVTAATPTTMITISASNAAASTSAVAGTAPTATVASGAANANSNDPLKDEIGSILAANLMPSKEESGKIFGIASVSLAQSSGPDNTKCTLGKCGSIHKPVLGPVVPTEGYIGDQLSSKERRKAKVNMTHEQIQKWLIECSSNPDEIHDDLDDDYDDNLRPNLFTTTPPPTRDDKESTSFSSSSKATRDLGKSESAWSAKGPSLKAIPVVATSNRKEDNKQLELSSQLLDATAENDKNSSAQAINLTQKSNLKQHSGSTNANEPKTQAKEKSEKKSDKKLKEDKTTTNTATKETTNKDNKQSRADKERETSQTGTKTSGKQTNATAAQNQATKEIPTSTAKLNKKKNASASQSATSTAQANTEKAQQKGQTANTQKASANASNSDANNSSTSATKTPKRMPVYNQKAQKATTTVELKETTTTSHKKTAPFSYGAFSADNEKSIYSFDKDDFDGDGTKPLSKPAFRRQSRRDSSQEEPPASGTPTTTPTTRASPAKKRVAAAAAEKANKDLANASQNSSVSLTLSPSENCKLVKVSLDAEKTAASKTTPSTSSKTAKNTKKAADVAAAAANANAEADSDSDGHTFYIPLQGSGVGGDAEGGIQGVAVKLGREGPDGPNQKVIMHATLVTKAQMGSNSKPLPDSMNVSDIVKTVMTSSASSGTAAVIETSKKSITAGNTAATTTSVTVQPRLKASEAAHTSAAAAAAGTTSAPTGSSGLVRVNSNSSLFSGSAKSRLGAVATAAGPGPSTHNINKKFKDDTPIKMSNNTAFPRHDDPTQMVEAPIFRPTEKEFADPIEFIERITPIAARFGICKIIPPNTFKPECRISDEMRFTAYNQYVHKMLHRWGPSAKELSAIKKYLTTQSIVMNHPPWIGGMEVDLPRLYHTVQELGGLKEVIEKKKWARVAEEMCIPKLAQDRVTKLDDIYCKYLLPYDTLSPTERQKLFDEVEADWAKREARARRNADRFVNTESVSNEEDDVSSEDDEESEEEVDGVSMECIVKGRSMPLSQFYRIARNTMALWFKNTEPTVNEVEAEFWRHVAVRDSHVCVHSGSIDSSGWGYGFPSPGPKGKGSNYARHPWNLKVLTNNPGSVLRSLGPVMGVTVPTLHVGMLFSACCWYRDPHGLSWIEYLHTGASKLWYGIPDDQSANFRAALTSLIPTHCQNKTIWLPCDTVMVPPHMLTDRGVSLCRIEQKPGEFIVVFPRAYTSSLATGYVVSESVYFATTSWLDLAKDDFRDIHDSCEPAMFSLEQLLFALGYDQRVSPDTLQQMQPMLYEVFEKETAAREQLKAAGVTSTEKVHSEKSSKAKKQQPPFKSIESECDLCRANLYISMVKTEEGNVYCLQHALKNLNNGNIQAKQCKLIYAYNVEDIEMLIKNLKDRIQQKRHAVVNKKQGK